MIQALLIVVDLDRIVGRPDQECGTSGTISQRIAHCSQENGLEAFYDSVQYGGGGEGDWRLVTRLVTGEEVWRDERTKLLWSDKARGNPNINVNDKSHPSQGGYYNWFQASGYAKDATTSQSETVYVADPDDVTNSCHNGSAFVKCQPSNPISVCKIFIECDKKISDQCETILGKKWDSKGRKCIHGEAASAYMPIYETLDTSCKKYISFKRECEYLAKDLCDTYHLRSSLKCLNKKRDKMPERCSLLLNDILAFYGFKPSEMAK